MICFFVESGERAQQVAAHLDDARASVDGPFHTHRGEWRGVEARVYTVEHQTDAAYGAARIAQRRGASRLIAITEATLIDEAAEELSLMPGQLVRARAIFDLAPLAPLLRLLSDSAREFPMPLKDGLPTKPLWEGDHDDSAPALGTPPWSIDNPHLSRALYQQRGIALLDRQMAGFAAAATETSIPFFPLVLIRSVHTAEGKVHSVPLQLTDDFERMVGAMMKA